jgi:hypothetical protein
MVQAEVLVALAVMVFHLLYQALALLTLVVEVVVQGFIYRVVLAQAAQEAQAVAALVPAQAVVHRELQI